MLNKKAAFTLIELLVVIAIIGILATLATFSVTGAKERARDAGRKGDLSRIKASLEIYFADQNPNTYKVSTSVSNLDTEANARAATGLLAEYLKNFPLEPSNTSAPYTYQTDATGKNYVLTCKLENANDSDIKASAPTGFTLPSGYNYYVEND